MAAILECTVQHSHACESRFSLDDPCLKRYKGLGVKFAQGSEDWIDRKEHLILPLRYFSVTGKINNQ